MHSVGDWHKMHGTLSKLANGLHGEVRFHPTFSWIETADSSGPKQDTPGQVTQRMLAAMPDAALHVWLEAAREIVLSGFQLELYAAAERPVAYWYAKRILEADVEVLGRLLEVVPEGGCSRLFYLFIFFWGGFRV
jgi:hypothetical protein